jgi:hypothetical protein
MSSTEDWPFDQTPNTAAMTTRQVLIRSEPIRYVVHYDDDDSWAFLCGTTDLKDDYKLIHMAHALDMDSGLRSVADLPPGWSAWQEDEEIILEKVREDSEAGIRTE